MCSLVFVKLVTALDLRCPLKCDCQVGRSRSVVSFSSKLLKF